ncbi:MarR family transcriptional regulator [Agromyces sp. PvR057]|uniref:MarR family winged helix-turn-helix transcriptional regulator n=1 Tax=Agromyces sp. PvR057 TaxID=3156403 RepID=UPI000E3651E0
MRNRLTPRQEIWRGLLYGQRAMMLRLTAELKAEYGLTVPQYEALLLLWESPDRTLTSSALAAGLLYSSGSASHLIGRLAEQGHVARTTRADDARVIDVSLTEAGTELIVGATAAHLASLRAEFEPLIADDELEALLAFARRLAAHEGVASAPPEE